MTEKGVLAVLKKKTIRIPLLSLAAGIIFNFTQFRITVLLVTTAVARGMTIEYMAPVWTLSAMLDFILAAIFFIIIARFFLRDMTGKEIARSAGLVTAYPIVFIPLQQGLQSLLHAGRIPFTFIRLSTFIIIRGNTPVAIYSTVGVGFKMIAGHLGVSIPFDSLLFWAFFVPDILAPLLFIPFGKAKQPESLV